MTIGSNSTSRSFKPRERSRDSFAGSGRYQRRASRRSGSRASIVLDEIANQQASRDALRESVSQTLFSAVGGEADRETRRNLINVRRKLYNDSVPNAAALSCATKALKPDDSAAVLQYAALLGAHQSLLAELAEAVAEDRRHGRRILRGLLKDESLRRGILASSPSLFAALQSYETGAEAQSESSRERTERGLLRYVTRTGMKATPFSTLCGILVGSFVDDESDTTPEPGQEAHLSIAGELARTNVVRLNKRLFGVLSRRVAQLPELREKLAVELNPTLRETPEVFLFLAVPNGRETFQRIEKTDVLSLIIEFMRGAEMMTLKDLVTRLEHHPALECDRSTAEQFANSLLSVGLLRLCFGIPEQEPEWHVPFAELLERMSVDSAKGLATELRQLGDAAEQYRRAVAAERDAIAANALAIIAQMLARIGLPANAWDGGQIFFEDVGWHATAQLRRTPQLTRLLADLRQYVSLTSRVSPARDEHAAMRHFFDEHYAAPDVRIELLAFYEDFHRDFQKEHLRRLMELGRGEAQPDYNFANPFKLASVEQAGAARRQMGRLIAEAQAQAPHAAEVRIAMEDLARCVKDIANAPHESASAGMFVDFIEAEKPGAQPRVVLNKAHYVDGYGKFFSRFLHVMPEDVVSHIRARNDRPGGSILAEIAADGNFNPNLHPPLLPAEIGYPTTEAAVANVLSVGDLYVMRVEGTTDRLTLWHEPTGRTVTPIDLGFQTREGRPALFQLLTRFAPGMQFIFPSPDVAPMLFRSGGDGSGAASQPAILRTPRVVLNDTIVLARQSWIVPSTEVPIPEAGESDDKWLLRLDAWRKKWEIPREVYMRIRPRLTAPVKPEAESPGETPKAASTGPTYRGRKNLMKPQYMDLRSPMMLRMLSHSLRELPLYILILEERYPAGDQLATLNCATHATELFIELET